MRHGFLYEREVETRSGRRLIGVLPLLFDQASLGIGDPDSDGFDDVWDFPSRERALAAAEQWNPDDQKEPEGWHRHPRTGRRRHDGDPAAEYMLR